MSDFFTDKCPLCDKPGRVIAVFDRNTHMRCDPCGLDWPFKPKQTPTNLEIRGGDWDVELNIQG